MQQLTWLDLIDTKITDAVAAATVVMPKELRESMHNIGKHIAKNHILINLPRKENTHE
jgi:hypothetical protein